MAQLLDQTITEHSVTGRQTTAGVAEETLLLVVDGAAPAATFAVPEGQSWEISDLEICIVSNIVKICLQESRDNGVTWFNHLCIMFDTSLQGSNSRLFSLNAPIRIDGAPNKLFRAQVTTPQGALLVTATIRLATSP